MKPIRKIKLKHCSREILKYLGTAGAVMIAAQSPYFSVRLFRAMFVEGKPRKRPVMNAFYYLKKKRLIVLKREGRDIILTLTKEGKKKAGKYQIEDLRVERPKRWDGKWRVVIFDIPTASNMIRDVFRGKIREFNFYQLQKSVWVYPFDCREEIDFLREFLGVSRRRIRYLEVSKIDDDAFLRKYFDV